jgi:hypothetical protein
MEKDDINIVMSPTISPVLILRKYLKDLTVIIVAGATRHREIWRILRIGDGALLQVNRAPAPIKLPTTIQNIHDASTTTYESSFP